MIIQPIIFLRASLNNHFIRDLSIRLTLTHGKNLVAGILTSTDIGSEFIFFLPFLSLEDGFLFADFNQLTFAEFRLWR